MLVQFRSTRHQENPPWPRPPPARWTTSSPSPRSAASCSLPVRSMAEPDRHGTTGRSAWRSRRTSRSSGGAPSCSRARTWWAWTPRSSSPPSACGRPPVMSRRSPIRWSSAVSATTATARTTSSRPSRRRRGGALPRAAWRRSSAPHCGTRGGEFTEPQQFSGLMKTFLGAVDNEAGGLHYLRPETAQGIFVNFNNVVTAARMKPPVRHRPGRQGLPQRDHARQLHLPDPRVRADGDRVLHPAVGGGRALQDLGRGLLELVRRPGHRPGEPATLRRPGG